MLSPKATPYFLHCCLLTALPLLAARAEPVDFSKEILPLLSDNCFGCHGPDASNRKAGLQLDKQAQAIVKLKSGNHAIVPGESGASSILERLQSTDSDELMPPPDSGKTVSPEEIARIKRWIDEGAEWGGHWAFEAPKQPVVPKTPSSWNQANQIDAFIHESLHSAQLTPEREADKETLIRRVTLDLTGLPPTVEEINAFLADDSGQAYEHVVDRLLRSKKYEIGRAHV